MSFIGKSKKFAIATTVTISGEMINRAVRMEGKDTTHFLLTVAVGGEETSCKTAIDDLYLSAKDGDRREKGLYPVVDAGTDDEYFRFFG